MSNPTFAIEWHQPKRGWRYLCTVEARSRKDAADKFRANNPGNHLIRVVQQ